MAESAKSIQNDYKMGSIQARFSSVPLDFFHTAIEVKIQSSVKGARKDIDTLSKIKKMNKRCNCFLVVLNARGPDKDHKKIASYAELKEITLVDYSCKI